MMGSNAMTLANTFGNIPAQSSHLAVGLRRSRPTDGAARAKVETRQFIRVLQGPDRTRACILRTLFFSLQECQKGARRPKDIPRFDVKKVGIHRGWPDGSGYRPRVGQGLGSTSCLIDRDLASAERGRKKVQQDARTSSARRVARTPERVEGNPESNPSERGLCTDLEGLRCHR